MLCFSCSPPSVVLSFLAISSVQHLPSHLPSPHMSPGGSSTFKRSQSATVGSGVSIQRRTLVYMADTVGTIEEEWKGEKGKVSFQKGMRQSHMDVTRNYVWHTMPLSLLASIDIPAFFLLPGSPTGHAVVRVMVLERQNGDHHHDHRGDGQARHEVEAGRMPQDGQHYGHRVQGVGGEEQISAAAHDFDPAQNL